MNNVKALRPNTIDPTGARSFPNVSIETKMLVEMCKDKPEGTTISYAEMEKEIGRPVTPGTAGYGYLASAKRILLRDHSIVVDAEPKVGVRVCTNEEKILVSGRDMKRSRRALGRSKRKLESVEYERLTDERKREWNARMALLGGLALLGSSKAVEKVQGLITDHVLPSAKVLELFRR